jgi:hypothetical protein
VAGGAFGLRAVAFETWIQVILIPRLRLSAANEIDPPPAARSRLRLSASGMRPTAQPLVPFCPSSLSSATRW